MTGIDAIFDVDRSINGLDAAARLEARQRLVRSLVGELHAWMLVDRDTMSRHNSFAKAIARRVARLRAVAPKLRSKRAGSSFRLYGL